MKEKIINYFFDEDELELVKEYWFLFKVAAVTAVLTLIINII